MEQLHINSYWDYNLLQSKPTSFLDIRYQDIPALELQLVLEFLELLLVTSAFHAANSENPLFSLLQVHKMLNHTKIKGRDCTN